MAPSPTRRQELRANDLREAKSKALTMHLTGSAMPTGLSSPMREKVRHELIILEARAQQEQRAHRAGRNAHQRQQNQAFSIRAPSTRARSRSRGGTKKMRRKMH